MRVEQDFKEFIALLNNNNVQYLIVGGYAYSYYAEPRFTKDIDIFVATSVENANKLMAALEEFGFKNVGLTAADFLESGKTIQLGQTPIRIDLLTSIDGVLFDEAWQNRTEGTFGDIPAYFIAKQDLLKNKRAAGRLQDIADSDKLNKI
jgi:hypothetical protein